MMSGVRSVQWDGWEVVEVIGRGSFGTVYRIQHDVIGDIEEAALKVITIPQNEDEVAYLRCGRMSDKDITQTFQKRAGDIAREYKLMKQLRNHPNIVHCDDFRAVQHDNGLGWDIYIKMELLTPLMKALDKVQTEEQIIRLGLGLCNALVACHKKNIIHRDIKPQNVFVSAEGVFKLGDFGIARTLDHTTHATAGIGTYSYMAPEVEKNEEYGKTADIYSLGLLLYWLLNEGRGPFMPLPPTVPKYGDDEKARKRRVLGEAIPAPKHGSTALKAIVLKACAYDPKERYADPADMKRELEALLYGSPVPPIPEPEPVWVPGPLPEPVEEPEEETVGPEVSSDVSVEDSEWNGGADYENMTVGPVSLEMEETEPALLADSDEWTVGPAEPIKMPKMDRKWLVVTMTGVLLLCVGVAIGLVSVRRETELLDNLAETTEEMHSFDVTYEPTPEPTPNPTPEATSTPKPTPNDFLIQYLSTPVKNVIDAGRATTMALRLDGRVEFTGDNDYGQWDINDWENIVSVAAGDIHAVGLLSSGKVVTASLFEYASCNVEDWSDIVSISARYHTVGLKEDGTVLAVGENEYGECNTNAWKDIVAVAAGLDFTVGLRSDGTVIAIGKKDYNQCAVSDWTDIVAISAGDYHTVGLKSNGTVITTSGECKEWTGIVAVSAGSGFTVGLKADGTVIAVGNNDNGQCNVEEWSDIIAISAGVNHTIGLKTDGTMVSTGKNEYGCCSVSKLTDIMLP